MTAALRFIDRLRHGTEGSVAILTALTFPILVGGMALGAEASFWYLSQRKLQQASDLAAYSAAVQVRRLGPRTAMEASAQTAASGSGMDADLDVLSLVYPPQSGSRTGDDRAVEVLITRQQPRFFSLIYSDKPVEMSARSVAEVRTIGEACLLALDPSASGAVTLTGSPEGTFVGCDVATNSSAEDALVMKGGPELTADCIQSAGGIDVEGNLTLADCDAPRLNAPPISDPFATLEEPTVPATCEDATTLGSWKGPVVVTPTETTADGIPRQCYEGLSVRDEVEFSPGLYIIKGGTLRINNDASVSGDGVTFFLTEGADIHFNGSATIDFTAPISGRFAGVLFYADSDDVGVHHTVNGGASSRLSGAIYLPSGDLTYNGSFESSNNCMQIVSRRVELSGGSSLTVDCTPDGGRSIPTGGHIALVE